jgi:cyclic pyranopterin phosphate synthase
MSELTHFNEEGRPKMVDVSEKAQTTRTAVAAGEVLLRPDTYDLVVTGKMKKGDVLSVAQVAGIMGAKRTSDVIPMCHPIAITGVDISFALDEKRHAVLIEATAKCKGETGVEMEALTAVSVAALTIYDMCKAVQKDIEIQNIRLLSKTGGKSGTYHKEEK